MNLEGKRILLTGASGGIGRALAAALERSGCQVLRHSYSKVFDDDQLSVRGDLMLEKDIEAVVVAARNFNVDIVINNCGVNELTPFEMSGVQRTMDINVSGPMKLTQALLPFLREKPEAAIVNIGSTFGEIGFPGYVTYCASKAAIKGFSEALRRELSDSSVHVFHVSPRATKTDMNSPVSQQLNAELGNAEDEPDYLAARIVNAMQRDQVRLQIGFMEKIQVKLNGLFPGIFDLAIGSQLPIIKKHLSHHSDQEITV